MDPVTVSRRTPSLPLALELPTVLELASMAGFLFNMSVVTAPALNALSPDRALAAWKGINSTVRNPLFAGTAFGLVVLVVHVRRLRGVRGLEFGASASRCCM
jgi:uncharacterized membrane protein